MQANRAPGRRLHERGNCRCSRAASSHAERLVDVGRGHGARAREQRLESLLWGPVGGERQQASDGC